MGPGRETAVLFAELIGTAELYARASDTAAHDTIARGLEKLGQAAASCGAQVMKTIGGRLMLLAANADAAARAAVAMHVAASDLAATNTGNLSLGVGFCYGPVIQDKDDVFGDTVNLAARLVEQAAKGQILFAAETAAALSTLYRRSMRRLYSIPVKGRSEEVALCELVWRTDEPETFLPLTTSKPSRAKLTLNYRGAVLVLRHGSEELTVGRGDDCSLALPNAEASRHHCTIQRRNDHFVVIDRSTNGTYVTVEGEAEVLVQHDELILRRRGWIFFGTPRGGSEGMQYFCE